MMLFWMKTSARTCGKIDNQHMSESFFDLCFLHAPNESACADSPHEQWVRFSLGFFHHFVEIPWSFKRQENMCKFPTSSLWIPPVSSWINEHGYGNPGNPPLGAPHSWRLFRIFQPRSGCFPSMAIHLTKRLVPGV
jgi:hypothetical protein